MSTVEKAVRLVILDVNTAWDVLCSTGKKTAQENRKAILALAVIVKAQKASMTSIAQSIKDTGKSSSIKGLTYASIKGLPTFLALSKSKVHGKEFNAMTLDKAITFANKSYDLLGKGKAESIGNWEDLNKSIKDAQDEKTRKAKELKESKESSKGKTPKTPKEDATLEDGLIAMLLLCESIQDGEIGDKEIDLINTIQAVLDQKMSVDA